MPHDEQLCGGSRTPTLSGSRSFVLYLRCATAEPSSYIHLVPAPLYPGHPGQGRHPRLVPEVPTPIFISTPPANFQAIGPAASLAGGVAPPTKSGVLLYRLVHPAQNPHIKFDSPRLHYDLLSGRVSGLFLWPSRMAKDNEGFPRESLLPFPPATKSPLGLRANRNESGGSRYKY